MARKDVRKRTRNGWRIARAENSSIFRRSDGLRDIPRQRLLHQFAVSTGSARAFEMEGRPFRGGELKHEARRLNSVRAK